VEKNLRKKFPIIIAAVILVLGTFAVKILAKNNIISGFVRFVEYSLQQYGENRNQKKIITIFVLKGIVQPQKKGSRLKSDINR
jgi:hypothetical protein